MITLRLQGSLAACVRAESAEEVLKLEARSVGEALRLVAPQAPGFELRLKLGNWRITVDGKPVGPAEVDMLLADRAYVSVAPALSGAAVASWVWWTVGTLAAGAILGEYAKSLIPDMDPNDLSAERRTLFSGPVNSVAEGGAVPLLYGTVRVGSTVVSGGITPDRPTGGDNATPAAIGLGGQPAGGQQPVEDRHDPFQDPEPDRPGSASRAASTLRVVDLLGEGEIEGLVDGLKSVFIDNVAVEDEDGSAAVEGVSVQVRRGLAHNDSEQEALAGFAVTATGLGHARTKVVNATPVINEAPAGYDAARVTLLWPRLIEYAENGEIAAEVVFRVASRPAGGVWETVLTQTIRDLSLDERELAWRVERPESVNEAGRWEIRVSRDTQDSTSTEVQDEFYWQRTAGLRDVKQSYPHSAVAGLVIETERTDLNPTRREYLLKGRKVLTPPTAVWNPDAPTPTSAATYGGGMWDGRMVRRWTDNPAWIVYDLLTDRRAGLGAVPGMLEAARNARAFFLEWSRRCDGLVPAPDSEVDMEPRWRFNGAITKREQAKKVIDWVSSASRAGVSWGGGHAVVAIDGDSDVAAAIGNANVLDGEFEYQGPRWQERYSAVGVTWQNPEDGYRSTIELVQDNALVAKYGHRQRDVAAVGCTSRGQAHRIGLLALNEQENESETVKFRMALEGLHLRPGDRIRIADEERFEVAGAFRLRSVDTSTPGQETLTLDRSAPRLAAGGRIAWGAGREAAVARAAGQGDDVLVTTDAPTGLVPGDLVVNEAAAIDWIVAGLTERDKAEAAIEAKRYDPNKYTAIEQRRMLAPPLVETVARILPPTAVTGLERTYEDRNVVRSLLEVGVRGGDDPRIGQVEYQIKRPKRRATPEEIAAGNWRDLPLGPWEPLRITSARSIVERNVALGGYRLRARFLGGRRRSVWAESAVILADGKTDALAAPEGLTAEGALGGYWASWTRPAALDYAYTEIWDRPGNPGPANVDVDVEDGNWTLRGTIAGSGFQRADVSSTDTLRVAVRHLDTSELKSPAREVGVTPLDAIEGADGTDGVGWERVFAVYADEATAAAAAGPGNGRVYDPTPAPGDGFTDGLVGLSEDTPWYVEWFRTVPGLPARNAAVLDSDGNRIDGFGDWRRIAIVRGWGRPGLDGEPGDRGLSSHSSTIRRTGRAAAIGTLNSARWHLSGALTTWEGAARTLTVVVGAVDEDRLSRVDVGALFTLVHHNPTQWADYTLTSVTFADVGGSRHATIVLAYLEGRGVPPTAGTLELWFTPAGEPGFSVRWRGDWATGQVYEPLDMCTSDGRLWINNNRHRSSSANRPTKANDGGTHWSLAADQGQDGRGIETVYLVNNSDAQPAIPASSSTWPYDQPPAPYTDDATGQNAQNRVAHKYVRGVPGTPAVGTVPPTDAAQRAAAGWTDFTYLGKDKWGEDGIKGKVAINVSLDATTARVRLSWTNPDVPPPLWRITLGTPGRGGQTTWGTPVYIAGAETSHVSGLSSSLLTTIYGNSNLSNIVKAKIQAAQPAGDDYEVAGVTQAEDVITNEAAALDVPAFTASAVLSGSVFTSWGAVDRATIYDVYRAQSENAIYGLLGSTSSTSYTDNTVVNGRTYWYKVRARRVVSGQATLTGSLSDAYGPFTPQAASTGPPTGPSNGVISNLDQTGMRGSWTAPSSWGSGTEGSREFYLELRRQGSAVITSGKVADTVLSFDFTGLTPATSYELRVWAETDAGRSRGYASVTASTLAPAAGAGYQYAVGFWTGGGGAAQVLRRRWNGVAWGSWELPNAAAVPGLRTGVVTNLNLSEIQASGTAGEFGHSAFPTTNGPDGASRYGLFGVRGTRFAIRGRAPASDKWVRLTSSSTWHSGFGSAEISGSLDDFRGASANWGWWDGTPPGTTQTPLARGVWIRWQPD